MIEGRKAFGKGCIIRNNVPILDVSPTAEQSSLGKLLANWNAVMVGKAAVADKRAGQQQLL